MLPIILTNNSKELRVLIVGAGKVAKRRADLILNSGIKHLDIIAPERCEEFESISSKITFKCDTYQEQDLSEYFLVFACTDDPAVNARVGEDAKSSKTLFNLADDPESSDFLVPAIITEENLVIAVSTGIPSYTRELMANIEKTLPHKVGQYTQILGRVREALKSSSISRAKMKQILEKFSKSENHNQILIFGSKLENLNNEEVTSQSLELYTTLN